MESDTTRALGGEKQELLTTDKLFPTLRFFFTREGSSLVSQEVACLDLPSEHGVQAWCSTWPGHLGLSRYERRAVTPGTLSRLTSQKSVSYTFQTVSSVRSVSPVSLATISRNCYEKWIRGSVLPWGKGQCGDLHLSPTHCILNTLILILRCPPGLILQLFKTGTRAQWELQQLQTKAGKQRQRRSRGSAGQQPELSLSPPLGKSWLVLPCPRQWAQCGRG